MQLIRQPECFAVDSVDAEQLIQAMQRLGQQTEQERTMQRRNMEIMARQAKAPAALLQSL